MKTGQPYNPYRSYPEFAIIPAGLLASRDLSANHKIVFAALAKRAGKNGRCHPSQATLAKDCGLTRNQVRYALAGLLNAKLIRVRHGRPGAVNGYEFLWSTSLERQDLTNSQLEELFRLEGGGESFHHAPGQNSPTLVNGSPQKDSIKEGPTLVSTNPPRKPISRSACPDCDDTGWVQVVSKSGIQAVKRCAHG